MRTIKFRGRDEHGKWWYGDLRHTMLEYGQAHIRIIDNGIDELRLAEHWSDRIVPETIGQFTGLLDCNGQEIYEGDIVRIICDGKDIGGIYKMMSYTKGHVSSILPMDNDEDLSIIIPGFEDYLVIGNIHDNPELLKGGAK